MDTNTISAFLDQYVAASEKALDSDLRNTDRKIYAQLANAHATAMLTATVVQIGLNIKNGEK